MAQNYDQYNALQEELPKYDPYQLIGPTFRRSGRGDEVASRNERAVLSEIWRSPSSSRAEIVARLDLTQQSVHRIIDQLVERGMLTIGEPKPGTGRGKPSPVLLFREDWCFTIGISVNTDRAGVTLMHLDGRHFSRYANIDGLSMEEGLDRIEGIIDGLVAEHKVRRERLLGIGFGIAGFSVGFGTQFNASLPLHEWSLIELGPLLSQRFAAPVWTENVASAAAIAEAMFGVGRYIRNFAYLSFNFGFGGGIIVDGDLLRGGHGNAAELSNMFDHEEIDRRPALKFLLAEFRKHNVPVTTIWQLSNNFDENWPGVDEWLDLVTPSYLRLVNALYAILDPQAIVFGGEIPRYLAEQLIGRTRFFHRPRYGVAMREPKMIFSTLGQNPASSGAAVLPLKSALF